MRLQSSRYRACSKGDSEAHHERSNIVWDDELDGVIVDVDPVTGTVSSCTETGTGLDPALEADTGVGGIAFAGTVLEADIGVGGIAFAGTVSSPELHQRRSC